MHTSSRLVTLQILLPARDYRVFLAARRILVRIMGAKAPDTIGLILQNLRGRDVTGLADEYLDTVGWPLAANRAVSLRHPRKVAVATRLVLPRQRALSDPSRN